MATASLFARRVSPTERVCLLVSPAGNAADLLVLIDGRVVFQRTVRLPDSVGEEAVARRLAAEIQRTLVVAQQGPLASNPLEHVFLFGSTEEHQPLTDALGEDFGVPVSVVDPFAITDVPDDGLPERPGRFAALVGMILDESYKSHPIDFLHPKRPPPPANRRRMVGSITAAVAIVLGGIGYYAWSQIADADEQIERLTAERKDRDDLLKRTAATTQLAGAVRDWLDSEVVWLDELRDFSLRFPRGRDLVVQRMTMARDRAGGGGVELSGTVRDQQILVDMERDLRDQYHELRSKRLQERDPGSAYPWIFESSMSLTPRDRDSYLEQQASTP